MELYIRIPVRIEVRGTYHSITKFFKNLSELPRIVNVERLALSIEKVEAGGLAAHARQVRGGHLPLPRWCGPEEGT